MANKRKKSVAWVGPYLSGRRCRGYETVQECREGYAPYLIYSCQLTPISEGRVLTSWGGGAFSRNLYALARRIMERRGLTQAESSRFASAFADAFLADMPKCFDSPMEQVDQIIARVRREATMKS